MKKLILLALFIQTIAVNAQQNISYKAIVKDGGGAVIANQLVVVQFQILEGAAQTNLYTEQHTPTTDSNGLIILEIGSGTPISGSFENITWGDNDHYLNVQINSGGGLTDLGTTPFLSVPYSKFAETAAVAQNLTGLETLDEGNGTGWRFIGQNPDNYGNLGLNAVDLSYSNAASTSLGATGENSVAMGNHTVAPSDSETSLGSFNDLYTPDGSDEDRLFSIGNGTSDTDRKNALTVLKNGQHTINSTSSGLIINSDAFSGITTNTVRRGLVLNTPNMTALSVFGTNDGIIRDDAIEVFNAGRSGLSIYNSTSTSVYIEGGRTGLFVNNPERNGVVVQNSFDDGVRVEGAGDSGGVFEGSITGVLAKASEDENPDLILGGTSGGTGTDDDGIIASDPDYAGSDIFLRSNDAVVVQLDFDNNELGQFEIKAGNGTEIFEIDEFGNVRQNGTVIHSSDRRLKKDISEISYGLKEILQLEPKSYYWMNREQNHKSLGLIAQDVRPLIEEIVQVSDNKEKTLGISYIELIPILIKAIQEQQEIINSEKQKVVNLEGQLQQFKALELRLQVLEREHENN